METRPAKVYMCLPITGKDPNEVGRVATEMERLIRQQGGEAVNPLKVPHADTGDYNRIMGEDITALMGCDAVLYAEDWGQSQGCRMENAIARIMGKKAFFMSSRNKHLNILRWRLSDAENIGTYWIP